MRYYVGARFYDAYRAEYETNYPWDVEFTYDNYYLSYDGYISKYRVNLWDQQWVP